MKAVVYSFIFVVLLSSCSDSSVTSDNQGNIKSKTKQLNIKGSDTELPLTQNEIEGFLKLNPNASISLTGGGSSVGITALIEGNTDIAMASRNLTSDENSKLGNKMQHIVKATIAYDALAIIVNPSNPINRMTKEQLQNIYLGKVENWKEMGGIDHKLSALGREQSSGSYAFFKDHILDGKSYINTMPQMSSNGQIVESIEQSPNAIGYVGIGYVTSKVKALAISFDGGKTFINPTMDKVKNGAYKIARPLYYIYSTDTKSKVEPFLNFVLSDSGQKIVESTGFIKTN